MNLSLKQKARQKDCQSNTVQIHSSNSNQKHSPEELRRMQISEYKNQTVVILKNRVQQQGKTQSRQFQIKISNKRSTIQFSYTFKLIWNEQSKAKQSKYLREDVWNIQRVWIYLAAQRMMATHIECGSLWLQNTPDAFSHLPLKYPVLLMIPDIGDRDNFETLLMP